jgi:chlorite dismutase
VDPLDIREKGGLRAGVPQTSDRRLFLQLLAFGNADDTQNLSEELDGNGMEAVLYEDVNDPRGIGLLTWNESPDFFVDRLRPFLRHSAFHSLTFKPQYTMMGRTYALGHEPNLDEWLLNRPRKVLTDAAWKWHVWYPLRRKGEFNSMPSEEQITILREHGKIGHSFGEAGFAHDIRLACFGMDQHDNDFVIGLVGKELYPLSACIQAMRKTQQTSRHMQEMGPFFIGKAIWQKIASR